MAASSSNPHFQDPNPSSMPSKPPKSKYPFTHYFFSKSLIIILLLLLSFFPSKVPEIFNKTMIITKIWELIYLLVIGIAVSYGLFSRKMDSVRVIDDNIGPKESYLSGISHISSIFEDGFRDSYGFDEKQVIEFGKSDGKKMNQCFLGESMVVVNDEHCVLEQLGKPKSRNRNEPLCLPVRRLRSKSFDSDCLKSDDDGLKNGRFKGMVPIKLEEKFEKTEAESPIPKNWGSKSVNERTETGGIKGLNSRSMRCGSEKTDSESPIPWNWDSKSMTERAETGGIEGLKSQSMRFGREKTDSESPIPWNWGWKSMNERAEMCSIEGLKSQSMKFSMPLENKESKGKEINHETSKDFGKIKVEDGELGSSDSSLKPYKRGKSVRTNRTMERVLEAKVNVFESQPNERIEKGLRIGAKDRKIRNESDPLSEIQTDKEIGKGLRVGAKDQKIGNENDDLSESQTDKKIGAKDQKIRNESDDLSDTEPHSGEVDRKAEEFIAKFRKQIRLQRVSSTRRLNLW